MVLYTFQGAAIDQQIIHQGGAPLLAGFVDATAFRLGFKPRLSAETEALKALRVEFDKALLDQKDAHVKAGRDHDSWKTDMEELEASKTGAS